jgi:hypothetical protein
MTIKDLEARVKKAEKNGGIKVNITHAGQGNEGIWACLASAKDKKIYEKDTNGDTFEVFLMNHALVGGPTWGARLTVTSKGNMRPEITVDDLIKQMNEAVEAGDYPPMEAFKNA